jgi:hypothetical protein
MSEISFSIANHMTAAERFYKYFRSEYGNNVSGDSGNEFINEFIAHVPEVIDELETNLFKHQISDFYIKIKNLKYLCEYSEEFNRYWLLMRAISGGLKRLLDDPTQKHATDVYIYYYSNYGGRRKLKEESWFEGHRWEFLDRLAEIKNDDELNEFILEKIDVLTSYFDLYKKELEYFMGELKNINK